MKVAWNLKGGGITGFTMAEDELPVLCDLIQWMQPPYAVLYVVFKVIQCIWFLSFHSPV